MAKAFAKSFYKSKAWQDVRLLRIGMDKGLCQMCGKPGNEVDHIIELTPDNIDNELIALNLNNLRTLCGRCHKKKTREDHSKKKENANVLDEITFDINGLPIRAMPPLKEK